MIYESLKESDPVRQGDIFFDLPMAEISMARVLVVSDEGINEEQTWNSVPHSLEVISAIVPIKRVPAIVISQDCDNERAPDISFCEIVEFKIVEPRATSASKPKAWMSLITQHARMNLKWFYLPPASGTFSERMGVDFRSVFRLPSSDIRENIGMRKLKLNKLALEHFRARLADFFRRYAYDEWYPLNSDEFELYRKDKGDVVAFPWQTPSLSGDDEVKI